jgi:aminoglycoside phosphotransferase (APT) family kinase protein
VAANALVRPSGAVTLIDWQCPALGDPVHDLAIALSPGMAALYGHAPWGTVGRAAFWDAYGNSAVEARHAALAPLLSARIAAHFLAQAARGRAGYAAAAEAELAALEE